MSVILQQADLESDQQRLIDTLFRFLTPRSDASRFEWLYCKNPHGKARAWIAIDPVRDVVIGTAAAFPRIFRTDSGDASGWVLGDFCISDQYRSLGPALQLQRACLSVANSEPSSYCYDFPSSGMMAVYKRLHINSTSTLLRLAKPLRVDRKVHEFVRSPLVARGLSSLGNLLLRARNISRHNPNGIQVELYTGRCKEEFSQLEDEAHSFLGLHIRRSADYLNWRYIDNPLYRYELFTARSGGALVAYAVLLHDGEDTILVDLFGFDDRTVIGALLENVIATLSIRGILTVSVPMIESHPWLPLLQTLGFKVRETNPAIIYSSPLLETNPRPSESQRWCLMHGDRDS